METVSDFGTVDFFAVETITLGIFNLWLGMNNLASASQLALVGFTFVVVLLALELYARKRQNLMILNSTLTIFLIFKYLNLKIL